MAFQGTTVTDGDIGVANGVNSSAKLGQVDDVMSNASTSEQIGESGHQGVVVDGSEGSTHVALTVGLALLRCRPAGGRMETEEEAAMSNGEAADGEGGRCREYLGGGEALLCFSLTWTMREEGDVAEE